MWQQYKDQNVQFLGLSGNGIMGGETPALVQQFAEQTGVTFPLLLNDTTKNSYANPDGSITPYPLDVVADGSGTIVYLRHELDAAAIEQAIQQALSQQ